MVIVLKEASGTIDRPASSHNRPFGRSRVHQKLRTALSTRGHQESNTVTCIVSLSQEVGCRKMRRMQCSRVGKFSLKVRKLTSVIRKIGSSGKLVPGV